MKFLYYLKEGYETTIQHYGKYYAIYKNPDRKEILETRDRSDTNFIMYIADYNKKCFYIFPVNILHVDIYTELYNGYEYWLDPDVICGSAEVDQSGKLIMNDNNEMDITGKEPEESEMKIIAQKLKHNWSWLLTKGFKSISRLDYYRRIFATYHGMKL